MVFFQRHLATSSSDSVSMARSYGSNKPVRWNHHAAGGSRCLFLFHPLLTPRGIRTEPKSADHHRRVGGCGDRDTAVGNTPDVDNLCMASVHPGLAQHIAQSLGSTPPDNAPQGETTDACLGRRMVRVACPPLLPVRYIAVLTKQHFFLLYAILLHCIFPGRIDLGLSGDVTAMRYASSVGCKTSSGGHQLRRSSGSEEGGAHS